VRTARGGAGGYYAAPVRFEQHSRSALKRPIVFNDEHEADARIFLSNKLTNHYLILSAGVGM
jgi:hypothetical protein